MHRCEAMWIRFGVRGIHPSYAVKVSAGGVNAITGRPRHNTVQDMQDYVAVAESSGKTWVGFSSGAWREALILSIWRRWLVKLIEFEDGDMLSAVLFRMDSGLKKGPSDVSGALGDSSRQDDGAHDRIRRCTKWRRPHCRSSNDRQGST